MDKAIAFYESIGLLLQQRWENHYAMIGTTGVTLGLHPGGDKGSSSGSVSIGFMIQNIDEVRDLLKKNGIAFNEDKGKSGHYLHFKDPDGTILYFVLPGWG